MSDPVLPTSRVRIEFCPYNYGDVRTFLHCVVKDFGLPGRARKWQFETVSTPDTQDNFWIIDFYFCDVHDAVIFGLRHQR